MAIGRHIKARRAELNNMTQEDLARRAGVLREYISAVESGRITPSLKRMEMMARALDEDVAAMLEAAMGTPVENELDAAREHPRVRQVLALMAPLDDEEKERLATIIETIVREYVNRDTKPAT